ncbi:MAG: trypsin-like peptidase domain-containing protein [Chloroflexota bacterium]
MTSASPIPVWNSNLVNLRDLLADLYWDKNDARRLAQQAGLRVAMIAFSDKPIATWHNILTDALNRHKLEDVIDAACQEFPENNFLAQAKQGQLTSVRGKDIAQQVAWQEQPSTDHLEKIIGSQPTLLPISFLETGLRLGRAVARIQLPDGASGTGFLLPGDLLLTNHHVLPDAATAAVSLAQFNYQVNEAGLPQQHTDYHLAPEKGFATSAKDDWSAVRVQGAPTNTWGTIPLAPADPHKDDFTIIIQHPMGGAKQIALYHNLITYVDERLVQYLTDTLPGSSGSPVFDTRWQVIALHHSGGWLREPASKQSHYRNEGIHINTVLRGMQTASLLP